MKILVRDDFEQQLGQLSPLLLYRREPELQKDVSRLKSLGYKTFEFDLREWHSIEAMHKNLQTICRFPSHYGRNFDALWDCLCNDLSFGADGRGVFVFQNFISFEKDFPRETETLLELLAQAHRVLLFSGIRLLICIQCSDENYRKDGLGSVSTVWPYREEIQ